MEAIAVREARADEGPRALTVTELTRILRETLRSNPLLGRVLVRGEAGNVQRTPAGHVFFGLKDANAQIACVLFRDASEGLGFDLEDGMEVVASGDVDLYARRGEVQLVVRALTPAGVGAFWAAFQTTRRRLAAEGLFEESRKRPLPAFPRRIGVVTSEAGAVIHDVLVVLRRRYPLADVVVAPSLVQGPEAPASLRAALAAVQGRVDVVLVARGGGSLEDLWCFNDEGLARAIAACPVPVVSAVGHETDLTIVDFVADLRAPTPSAAAELVAPDRAELMAHVATLGAGLLRGTRDALRERWTALASLGDRLTPSGLRRDVESNGRRLRAAGSGLEAGIRNSLRRDQERLTSLGRRLHLLSPLGTLRRGYAILLRPDGQVVSRAGEARSGEALLVRLHDGRLHVHVEAKEDP